MYHEYPNITFQDLRTVTSGPTRYNLFNSNCERGYSLHFLWDSSSSDQPFVSWWWLSWLSVCDRCPIFRERSAHNCQKMQPVRRVRARQPNLGSWVRFLFELFSFCLYTWQTFGRSHNSMNSLMFSFAAPPIAVFLWITVRIYDIRHECDAFRISHL